MSQITSAQTDPEPDTLFIFIPTIDTSRVYSLGEVMVDASGLPRSRAAFVQRVSLAQIERRDAPVASDVFRLIPSASVQTNSRGETLVYLRNAGERQVALYFDGALLNVPWDNRFDVSLFPASVIQSINVSKGAPSLLYGANTLGGVINIVSRDIDRPGRFTEVTTQVGSPVRGRVVATHLVRRLRTSIMASAGYAGSDGDALPGGASRGFGQRGDDIRTNTQYGLGNGFLRLSHTLEGGARIASTLIHISGEKGVAPEMHKDPEISSVRFWRYPEWHNTLLILSGRGSPGVTTLSGTVWGGRFGQQIDQYQSALYESRAASQEDRDWTVGSRLILDRVTGSGNLRLAINGLTSRHDQENRSGQGVLEDDRTYRLHTFSSGVEYEYLIRARGSIVLGLNVDAVSAPQTADQPGLETDAAAAWSVASSWRLEGGWNLSALVGSRTRFPTMRERFDTALGRFVINPELSPERSLVAEAGVDFRVERFYLGSTAFFGRTDETIDQTVVESAGLKRRMRVNLDGSRVFGVESLGRYEVVERFDLEGHFTWTHVRAHDPASNSYDRHLTEKPAVIGRLAAQVFVAKGMSVNVESEVFGRAWSLAEDNSLARLDPALLLHVRASYLFGFGDSPRAYLEMFARADNLADTLYEPRLGLPVPGRTLQVGLKLAV